MGYENFPRSVAGLLTEDPNVILENYSYEFEYEAEEIVDVKLLGDYVFDVMYRVGANYTPGEEMVRYHPDGSGTPGSPAEWEWAVIDIVAAQPYDGEGNKVNFELTPEWKKKLAMAIQQHVDDDTMQDMLHDDAGDSPDEPDRDREYEERRDMGNL